MRPVPLTTSRMPGGAPCRVAALGACFVALLAGCGPIAPSPPADGLTLHRAELVAIAERLEAPGGPEGIDAFAEFLQAAVDRAAAFLGASAPPDAVARLVLDDLVDVGLGPNQPLLQRFLMVSRPRWTGPPIEIERFGANGFAEPLARGDGALRHFALSAAGAWVVPELWVEVAARVVGRDLVVRAGTDSAGDVAANARGRAFARWLSTASGAALRDRASVAAWTREAFGQGVP